MEKNEFHAVIQHLHMKGLTPKEIKTELDNVHSTSFITVDKTWIHYFTPETKEWTSPSEPAPKKAKTVKSVGKVMATRNKRSMAITTQLYRFNNILMKKHPHLAKKKVLFHQDNVQIHTCPAPMAKVGWLRTSDQTILSIHTRIVTHNARITVTYESGASSGSAGASGGASGVTGSSQVTEEIVDGTWRLHIRQLKETDRDCYMCQINTSPMISELGCLDIHVPPDIVYGGDTSADLAVAEGDNATLSCRATGHPPPRVSWRREDGESIIIRASTAGGSTFEKHDHYNGSLLHFYRVERRQMGAYLCIASNDVPPAVSKRVTLAVNFAPVVKAPNQLLGAPLGTDVQLECYVEAFPNTINYWVKNQRGTEDEMLLEG
ncbi:LACH protein, partial [Acromyrmex insinuator]